MTALKAVAVGAGYFAQFHLEAWSRVPDVNLTAVCELDPERAAAACKKYGIPRSYSDVAEMLDQEQPDFVDIITRPDTHAELCGQAFQHGVHVICQKPLAPTWDQARAIVEQARQAGVRFMVHDNFRFQPWHREIKRLLNEGVIGRRLHSLTFRSRPGDGWGEDAYRGRQPYFRDMPQLLVYETGVHFIDTFRYLAGEVEQVQAVLRRLNPVIQGEDTGLLIFRFASGAVGLWDANRYNQCTDNDPRLTFGEFLVEADGGSIRLFGDGRITIQPLGQDAAEHSYPLPLRNFAGDCVCATQLHFVERLLSGVDFETSGSQYLETLAVQEATYLSAQVNRPVPVSEVATRERNEQDASSSDDLAPAVDARRIVDLTLPINDQLPRASVVTASTIADDGWNSTTLSLYSHCGTHMDAPRHFLEQGATIDQQSLSVCCGPAKVLDLSPVAPQELIDVQRLERWVNRIQPGDRLLLRTDWHRRFGTPEYRHALPRISVELARWLAARRVALIGVEPPSVADVNNMAELTEVHQILLSGNVVIVEGLAQLDQLRHDVVHFIALPLRVAGGDGSPVRAMAIEPA